MLRGTLCQSGPQKLHPVSRYLMGVPTGSMPARYAPSCVVEEVPKTERNKKLAFAGMSVDEAKLIDSLCISIGAVDDKLEVGNLRSLVVGSIMIYSRMTQFSAVSGGPWRMPASGCETHDIRLPRLQSKKGQR